MPKPRQKGRVNVREAKSGDFKTFKTDRSVSVTNFNEIGNHRMITYELRDMKNENRKRFYDIEDANGQHTVVKLSNEGASVRRAPDAKGQLIFVAHDGTEVLMRKNEAAEITFTKEEIAHTGLDGAHNVSVRHKTSVDERGRPVTEISLQQAHVHQGGVHAPKGTATHKLRFYGKATKAIPEGRVKKKPAPEPQPEKPRKPFEHGGVPYN
jgi:hypothetical protein